MNRHQRFRRALAASALLILLPGARPLLAQITYLQLQPDGTHRLRQMDANGNGDAIVPLPFATMNYPTWSHDGAVLAVTAVDPATPGENSQNVFAISAANGTITKLTRYFDIINNTDNSRAYTFPFHKAFSPDRSALATFSINFFGAAGAGTSTFPTLEIHSITSTVNGLILGNDSATGQFHGGEGIDWAPNQNVLVTPLQTSAPNLTSGGTSGVTAISFVEPSEAALVQKRTQQITFPRADVQLGTGNEVPFAWAEHDYQPKFSPDGTRVAYVRSFQVQSLLDLTNPTPSTQSVRILNLLTGADTQVASFQQGFYVSTVSWSPNGTQLAFDIGAQAISAIGIFEHFARPETNQIYIVNVDGSGLRQVRGNGNSSPAFGPRINTGPPPQPVSLGNIATRLRVGAGDDALIGGFIITGVGEKPVVVRAIGPSLGAAGVQGTLADPQLELYSSNGTLLGSNDDWKSAQKAEIEATGVAPTNDRESALLRFLAPGVYTAVVRGKGNAAGVGLVEVYDLSQTAASRLANISTRGRVETGDNVMIGGIIIGGSPGGSARIVVRAIGPSLGAAGVSGALQDPRIDLYNSSGTLVRSNDNWKTTQQTEIQAAKLAPSDDRESALVESLAPGNYTAIVQGKNSTTGIALVEAYNVQ